MNSLDKREYILYKGEQYDIVMYEKDIKRAIRVLEKKYNEFALKLKFLIYFRDYNEGTKTDWKEKPCKLNLLQELSSPEKYRQIINNQREILMEMRKFYGKNV